MGWNQKWNNANAIWNSEICGPKFCLQFQKKIKFSSFMVHDSLCKYFHHLIYIESIAIIADYKNQV